MLPIEPYQQPNSSSKLRAKIDKLFTEFLAGNDFKRVTVLQFKKNLSKLLVEWEGTPSC